MAFFKSGNPVLKDDTFQGFQNVLEDSEVMTIQGTVNKTGFLLFTLFIPALYVWYLFYQSYDFSSVAIYFYVGIFGGLLIGVIISFKKHLAQYLAVVYAILEGLALGGLSALMELKYPGIVFQALLLTFAIFIILLVIYKFEIIKATENFKLIVASATGGIALFYIISYVLFFFGIHVTLLNDNSLMGIIFSLFVVVIASMNLVVDFDFIEQGVANKIPKYMEWYGAFALMVTLIWLYVEILRLLGKTRRK